jgi:hypothetical protein
VWEGGGGREKNEWKCIFHWNFKSYLKFSSLFPSSIKAMNDTSIPVDSYYFPGGKLEINRRYMIADCTVLVIFMEMWIQTIWYSANVLCRSVYEEPGSKAMKPIFHQK